MKKGTNNNSINKSLSNTINSLQSLLKNDTLDSVSVTVTTEMLKKNLEKFIGLNHHHVIKFNEKRGM